MIAKFARIFSSIIFKLFICFWLIAILSVGATHFISLQFTDESVVLAPNEADLRRLKNVIRHHRKFPTDNIDAFLERLNTKYKFGFNRPSAIWLKNSTNEVFPASDKGKLRKVKNYLAKNTFNEVASIKFKYARITGPLTLTINDKPYQLYLTTKNKQQPFDRMFLQLPVWIQFSIPLVISFIICWLLARSITRPLLLIKKSATQLGDGDLSVRVENVAKRSDELGQLATSFNQMAEKLSSSLSAQQRLLGDISHELRSPLTRLQMALGLAQKDTITAEELGKYFKRCELEVERLDNMIGDTLALSRLENSLQPLHLDAINVCALLNSLIEDAQFLANEKSLTIQLIHEDNITIEGDNQLLAGAFSNILNNAVKYSPSDSLITVSISHKHSWLDIEIADDGQGVPEQSLSHLFEPFYRVVDARDRQTGGTGLGLAIAKQAILAHGGKISAINNDTQGLTVTISLPL